ncbi:hypothetical protein btf_795 [Dehalococcoides mccartyi BTF08]|nr:hypothetical protein btf_795 [Dehalococcoides mccartyi BTF08]
MGSNPARLTTYSFVFCISNHSSIFAGLVLYALFRFITSQIAKLVVYLINAVFV